MGFNRSFKTAWLTETVRLQEVQHGAYEDRQEIQQALQTGKSPRERIQLRASALGHREKLSEHIQLFSSIAQWALATLIVIGAIAGASATLSALGNGDKPVNLMVALLALLGLHAVTLLLWLLSLRLNTAGPPGLGAAWLWLSKTLSRQPKTRSTLQAFTNVLHRNGALKPALGCVTHAIWVSLMAASILTLLGVLSVRLYQFQWETTLLNPASFVLLTQALGGLPSVLGFSTPPAAVVTESIGTPSTIGNAAALWSNWLIGCVVVYGFLPRVILLFVCITLTARRLTATTLNTALPGHIELHPRLMPVSEMVGIDSPAPRTHKTNTPNAAHTPLRKGESYVLLGLELANDTAWPPFETGAEGTDLGIIDSQVQRTQALANLHLAKPEHIIVYCDVSQTPDRSLLTFLKQLQHQRATLHLVFEASQPDNDRYEIWKEYACQKGIPSAQIVRHAKHVFQSLPSSNSPHAY